MVVMERRAGGGAILRGRKDNERIEILWWPCSGATIRRAAPEGASRKWVDECAQFANDEFANTP